jgi:hypothetical protein
MKLLVRAGLVLSVGYVVFLVKQVAWGNIGPFNPIEAMKWWQYGFGNPTDPRYETLWSETLGEYVQMAWLLWGVASLGWGASAMMLFDIVLQQSARAREEIRVLGISDIESNVIGYLVAAWAFGGIPLYWSALVLGLVNVIGAFMPVGDLAPMMTFMPEQSKSKGGATITDITSHFIHLTRMGRGFLLGAFYYVGLKYVGLT